MSSARGLANHSLYMARLLLDAWGTRAAQGDLDSRVLAAAFAPAVRLHLLDAYGWFMLALLRAVPLPELPPHSVTDLPGRKPGIAEPPEINEFRDLERGDWIARLQAPLPRGVGQRAQRQSLASSADRPHIQEYEEWHGHFSGLFARMSVSLDEC